MKVLMWLSTAPRLTAIAKRDASSLIWNSTFRGGSETTRPFSFAAGWQAGSSVRVKLHNLRKFLWAALLLCAVFAAWSWFRPYAWKIDPAARCKVVGVEVKPDQAYFWVTAHLKVRPGEVHDLGKPVLLVTASGIELMKRYAWPGNVRELENLVRRLAALYPQDEITAEIIEAELRTADAPPAMPAAGMLPDDITIGQAVELHLQRYFASFSGELPPPGLYQRVLAEVEYPLVLASMTATRGNQIKAAELLGLNRNTLRKKIRELGVNVYRASK